MRLLTLEVAGVVLVDFESDLVGALVEADQVVSTCGNSVRGSKLSSLDLFADVSDRKGLALAVGEVCALTVVLDRPAFAEPVVEVDGTGCCVAQVIEVRQIGVAVCTGLENGNRELVLVEQTQTGNEGSGTFAVCSAAGDHVVFGSNGSHLFTGGAECEQSPCEEVLGLDVCAVVELHTLLDFECVGSVAVCILGALVLLNNSVIENIVASHVGCNGVEVVCQVHNVVIGCVGVAGECAVSPVAVGLCAGTDDDLTLGCVVLFCFLVLVRALTAGAECHGSKSNSEKQAKDSCVHLFHLLFSSNMFLF